MPTAVDWHVIPYEPTRRREVLSLMTLVQGHETPEAEFVWWFEKNPRRSLNIFLAEHDGRIIGVSATNTLLVWCSGQEHLVPFALNVLTRPDYRGLGVFSALQSANETEARTQRCPFMLSFPNAASTPIFLNRLGWNRGAVAPLMLKIVKLDALLSLAPRLTVFKAPAKALVNPLTTRAFRRRLPESVRQLQEFDHDFDRLWQCERAHRRWGLVRDSTYLNWRYLDAPSERYTCHRILDGPHTAGYVITGTIEKKGLRLGFLADHFLAHGSTHRYPQALAAADALLRYEDLDAILCFAPATRRQLLRHLGFAYLPTTKRLNFIYKILDPGFGTLPFWDASRWQFALGDTDFF